MKKILYLGTHGQYNIGDELLLETFLSQLGEEHEYIINTYDPDFTLKQLGDQYKLEVFHTTRDRFRILSYILKSDLVFFGGGSILKELYASVKRNRYATLLMVLMVVSFAKIIGRKHVILGNIGIGPVETKIGLFLTWLIMSLVDYASVRDQISFDVCMRLKINAKKVSFIPDPVFVHEPKYFIEKNEILQNNSPVLKVALNLNYNIEHPDFWELFLRELAQGLTSFNQIRKIQVHTLPMQSGYKDHHDLEILSSFQKQIPEIEVIQHQPNTAQDIAKIIVDCDIVVAERFHTCIISAVLGKPLLPLIYDVKVREMTHLLNMQEYGLEIDGNFNAARFERTLNDLVSQARQVENSLRQKAAAIRQQLQAYFREINKRIEELA